MNRDELINEAINNIVEETKCFNCIHAPICFAQKGGVDLQLASGLGCYYYQAKIADDEMLIKKNEYDMLLRDYTLTYDNAYKWGLKVGEEKTAIEILQELYNSPHEYHQNKIVKLANKYGIELED